MPRHTLYAYVDGCDLDAIAATLDARFQEFVDGRKWAFGQPVIVNQRHGPESCSQPDDLPLWDLGLNLPLPDPDTEQPGWFSDVECIAQFLGKLQAEFGRDFIIGVAESEAGIAEDLFGIASEEPDLAKLRSVLGVHHA